MFTKAARIVLEDCKTLAEYFRDDAVYLGHRFKWITMLVLLRTVGHVLEKADASESPEAEEAIEQAWADLKNTRPEPRIFWEFIEEGRNNIVKEYKLGIETRVRLDFVLLNPGVDPESVPSKSGSGKVEYIVKFGPFAGRPQKEVILEAIEWWESYLDRIDTDGA